MTFERTTFEKVRAVVAEELGIYESEISPNASFVSLGADSMDIASLVLAIEDRFGLEIPQDDAQKLFTILDVVNYVDKNCCRV